MPNAATTKTIEELVESNSGVDTRETYDTLWGILTEFVNRIKGRFDLVPDGYSKRYQPYQSPDGKQQGNLETFHGPGMDWLLNSWMGSKETGFTNAHMNVWLGPETYVPHLGIVFGTVPDFFFYIDYVPRVDLQVNLGYLDKYFGTTNPTYLRYHNDSRYTPFLSQEHYMRIAMSPTNLCFTTQASPEAFEDYRRLGNEYIDRWFGWIDEATPTPIENQQALAQRDLWLRRYAIERDPVNSYSEKLLGEELARDLVKTMWGGNRTSQRLIQDLIPQG